MEWTKLGILNLILAAAKQRTFATEEELLNSSLGRKANTLYLKWVKRSLTYYPWSFAIRRKSLILSDVTPLTTWSYYYEFPPDKAQVWDIYTNFPNFVIPPTYDFSIYDGYFSTSQDRGEAANENGFIASNLSELKVLYTSTDVQPCDFVEEFVDALEREAAIELSYQLGTPPEKFASVMKYLEDKKQRAEALQSQSNPTRKTMGRGRIVGRIFGTR